MEKSNRHNKNFKRWCV